MAVLSLILIAICLVAMAVSGIWLIVLAFRQSFLWGCGYLVIPLVALFFIIKFWDEAKNPFLINLGAVILLFGAMKLSPDPSDKLLQEDPAFSRQAPASLDLPETTPRGSEDPRSSGDLLAGLSTPPPEDSREAPPPGSTPTRASPGPPRRDNAQNALPPPALPRALEPQNPRRVVGPTVTSRGAPSPQPRRIRIEPQNAAGHVGSLVEVVTIEKQRQRVILERVEGDRLHFNADGFHYSLPAWRVREMWIDSTQ